MRYGVILAGGGGTRLWPASRRARPKQLLRLLGGGETLLSATYRRARNVAHEALVVTAAEQAAAAADELGAEAGLLAEPFGRNTAAAIGLAAVHLAVRDRDAVLAILPSDHHIADDDGFAAAAGRAFALAEERGAIVAIGARPTRPETGFGYLELGDALDGDRSDGARAVRRFVEKPPAEAAAAMVASGGYLWNTGMSFARADRLLAEIARHLPDTSRALAAIREALEQGGAAAAETRAAELYAGLPSISIDHGVMERLADLLCIPGDFGWNDVGSWSALAEIAPAGADDNVAVGQVVAVGGARGNIAVAEPGHLVALIGVEDLVVVQAGDAVLVVPRARAQEVREAVAELGRAGLDRFL